MRYISLSDMRSSTEAQKRSLLSDSPAARSAEDLGSFIKGLFFVVCCFIALLFYCSIGYSELIDRVVAFIDDRAITLTELEDNYREMAKLKPEIKKEDVLNTMINRTLLLREARKLRIEGADKDAIIQEYIELKLKTLIRITEEDLFQYYEKNRKEFGNAAFEEIRDKIETYLVEKEVNVRLKKHIEDLRSRSYIKIMYSNP